MNGVPKVSVIVPIFNSVGTLQTSLRCLFEQALTDIEVIAVNDGSSDGSAQLLDRLAREESRMRVIHLAENGGTHQARAAGIKIARAPFVGFFDADDFVKPTMYEKMLSACEEHAADIAICGITLCSQERKKLGDKLNFAHNKTEDHLVFDKFCRIEYGTGSLCNKLYKRELVLKHALVTFRWRQDVSEDTLVNIGCFLEAKRIHLVGEQLYDYVVNPESATRSVDRAKSFVRMFRAYAAAVDVYQVYGREVLARIAELYMRQLRSSSYLVEHWTDLVSHEPQLAEAVELLAQKYPLGLAMLANAGWPPVSENDTLLQSVKTIRRHKRKIPAFLFREIAKKLTELRIFFL